MPLAATQEGQASGSRKTWSRARKRSRSVSSTTASMPTTTTRSRGVPSERSERRSKRSAALKERSKKGKRTRSDSIREDEEREAKKRNLWREEEQEEEAFSAGSSPLREPYIPVEVERCPDGTEIRKPIDMEVSEAFKSAKDEYSEKIDRQMELPTLRPFLLSSCLVDDPELLPIRESARKTVLCAAKFVIGLSSSVDGEPLTRCSGFWIDSDNENKTATVLTTAHLICSKRPSWDSWLCKDEYASDAEVNVHLRDGTIAKGHLLYYQKHYNLAFFRVRVDQPVQLPSFNDGVKCAQDVFELGRDEAANLMIDHGKVEYLNPTLSERHHYMYIQRPNRDRKYGSGGPVIDLDGKVVGIICGCTSGSFIPSSILLKCFHLWKSFQCIPRPHLGLKFSAISLLDPILVEKISLECNVDEGLIVEEVSEGSPAEKCGIRVGDVIESLNGGCISTTVELENMLLSICQDSGNCLNSEVEVVTQVYHTRKHLGRIDTWTVNVSDAGEIVVRGSYLVTSPSGPRSNKVVTPLEQGG